MEHLISMKSNPFLVWNGPQDFSDAACTGIAKYRILLSMLGLCPVLLSKQDTQIYAVSS